MDSPLYQTGVGVHDSLIIHERSVGGTEIYSEIIKKRIENVDSQRGRKEVVCCIDDAVCASMKRLFLWYAAVYDK